MKTMTQSITSMLVLMTLQCLPNSVAATSEEAQTQKFKLSAEAELGSVYNSHLRIDEIDQNSTAGDRANIYKLKIKGELKPTDKLTLNASYRYANKNYINADEYDQSLGHMAFNASYQFGFAKLGVNHNRIDVAVNNQDLLELDRTSYSISKLFRKRYFLKLSANQQSKSFYQLTGRNAEGNGISFDTFVFFNQARSYFNFSIEQFDEQANVELYDFEQTKLMATYSSGFDLFNKKNRLDLGWKHTARDYSLEENQQGKLRADTRNSLDVKWSLTLNKNIHLESQLEKTFADSNVIENDFDKNKASLTLKLTF